MKIFKKQEEEAEARKKNKGKKIVSVDITDSASSSANDSLNINNSNPHIKPEPDEEQIVEIIDNPVPTTTPEITIEKTVEVPPQQPINHTFSVSEVSESNNPPQTDKVPDTSVVQDIKPRRGRPIGSKNKVTLKFGSKLQSTDRYTKMKKSLAKRGINIASGSLGLRRSTKQLLKRKNIIRKRGIRSVLNPANVNVSAKVKRWKANLIGKDENPESHVSDPNWTEKEIIVTDVTSKSVTITFTECQQPSGFFKKNIL